MKNQPINLTPFNRRHVRYALAITLVATALCADRAAMAAPLPKVQESAVAEGLVQRLTRSFSRSVSGVRIYQDRQEGLVVLAEPRAISDEKTVAIAVPTLSPFQFRLPPPLA